MWNIITTVIIYISCNYLVSSHVSTSTYKLRRFLQNRMNITVELEKYIEYETRRLLDLKKTTGYEKEIEYLNIRLNDFRKLIEAAERNITRDSDISIDDVVSHPIRTYLTIKHFVHNYRTPFFNRTLYGEEYHQMLDRPELNAPQITDLWEAVRAIVRIQAAYNLSAHDIMAGTLMGNISPTLNCDDAYSIGIAAHDSGYPRLAKDWLHIALADLNHNLSNVTFAWKVALERIIHIHNQFGNDAQTEEWLERAMKLDTGNTFYKLYMKWRHGELQRQIDLIENNASWWTNYTKLCNQLETVTEAKSFHICRYRSVVSSFTYYRYKEEILHYAPYISLIHQALTDEYADILKEDAASKLHLGKEYAESGEKRDRPKSYGEAFDLYDSKYNSAAYLSRKVGDFTGLNTEHGSISYKPRKHFPSGEPIKVINHGIGGHYNSYLDFFTVAKSFYIMTASGDRLASVQLFLSDLKIGGHTIFENLGISVKPKKGMALFWYNYTPAGYRDYRTMKSVCPTVIGEKWEARKGIWTWGNEFKRPCGRKLKSTQFAVDKYLNKRLR